MKAGKSSLGNFLAGVDRAKYRCSYSDDPVPRFRVHAVVDGMLRQPVELDPEMGFATDVVECTDRIQEFTLGGFSWIDTPGLQSLTPENGDLARKYVENAELVVFLTPSGSPGRMSEIEELRRLLPMQKPLLVVVSCFDRYEEDIDESGNLIRLIVPKSDTVRAEQRTWVESQIAGAGLDDLVRDRAYVFVSTCLAREALKSGDEAVFESSGMADLYRCLSGVLTRDALELKKAGPRRRFNRLVEEILHGPSATAEKAGYASLDAIRKCFTEVQVSVRKAKADLRALGERIACQTIIRSRPKIESLLHAASRNTGMPRSGNDGLGADIETVVRDELQAVFANEVTRVLKDMDVSMSHALGAAGLELNVPDIERKYETIRVTHSIVGKTAGGIVGSVVGGMIGGALFGPIGAAIGGTLGGAVGCGAGEKMAGSSTIRVDVGTNVEEVKAVVSTRLEAALPECVSGALKTLADEALQPLHDASTAILASIDCLGEELRACQYDE